MAQPNFTKYLPTARGSRPLSTLSQGQIYVLWRSDLIRNLEAIAKSTNTHLDWRLAIDARRMLPNKTCTNLPN